METVSVTDPDPPEVKGTLDELRVTVGPEETVGETLVDRATVLANPFLLVTVIVDDPADA